MVANAPPRQELADATPVQFAFKPVEESLVAELLSNVNTRKTTGCDGISAKALKLAASALAPSLCDMFNEYYICFVAK